jgi:hypothetical protein
LSVVEVRETGLVWSFCRSCGGSGRVDHYIGDRCSDASCGGCGGRGTVFTKAPTITDDLDALTLAMLAEEGGAMLYWQVPHTSSDGCWQPAVAFRDAWQRGVIRFDLDSDCYTHPLAVPVAGGGFRMLNVVEGGGA